MSIKRRSIRLFLNTQKKKNNNGASAPNGPLAQFGLKRCSLKAGSWVRIPQGSQNLLFKMYKIDKIKRKI